MKSRFHCEPSYRDDDPERALIRREESEQDEEEQEPRPGRRGFSVTKRIYPVRAATQPRHSRGLVETLAYGLVVYRG